MDWFETRENKTKPQNQQQRILPFAAGLALGGAGAYAYGASMKTREKDKRNLLKETYLIDDIETKINKCISSTTSGNTIQPVLMNKCIKNAFNYMRFILEGKDTTLMMTPEDLNLLMHYEIIPRNATYSENDAISYIRFLAFDQNESSVPSVPLRTDLQIRSFDERLPKA